MSHSCLDDGGAIDVAAGLKFKPFLEYLWLNDNSYGPEGATTLGDDMPYLTEHRVLDISHNNVGPRGAVPYCGISHFTKLENLHLRNTNTDIDTATPILLSLKN